MIENEKYPLLSKIDAPCDLKNLSSKEEKELAAEIREYLIKTVSQTGGHLASNLGVVELTIALHKIFNTPDDKIVWDVGHQSYVHKLLTGRKELFDTLRTPGGLSGFTKRSESEYDPFGAGHSSTAISAAIGLAQADALAGRENYTVAVVGDGAFTGGLVHEALNNIDKNLHLIIIMNENEMSISKNTGSFAKYLAKIRATEGYLKTKSFTRKFVSKIPLIGKGLFKLIRAVKKRFKNSLYGSNYFEDSGLYYLGPADGNNIEQVENLLKEAIGSKQAVFLHLKTLKGCGYQPAEASPSEFHSVPKEGALPCKNFSLAFGELIAEKAASDEKICAITAAMTDGCGLSAFSEKFPERFFDVGIAEPHALVFAAGLAAGGMKPVFSVYSSFLQRGYDNILHDIALQKLPVTVMIDRASLAGADGVTHHGIFDVSFLCGIPNTEIYAPSTFASLRLALDNALCSKDSPTFIRYPNSCEFPEATTLSPISDFIKVDSCDDSSTDAVIITYGKILSEAVKAKKALADLGIPCKIILLEKLKPLSTSEILSLIPDKKIPVVFLEEGIKSGGVGENLYEELRSTDKMSARDYKIFAIEDFAEGVLGESLYKTCKISSEDITEYLSFERKKTLGQKNSSFI